MTGRGLNIEGFAASNRLTYPHPNQLGVGIRARPKLIGGCSGTQYGCCSGSVTAKIDSTGSNCPVLIGGCSGTQHGCCPGTDTAKIDSRGSNCPVLIGGCSGTQYGCCPNGVTAKVNSTGSNCSSPIGGCSGTQYGCCGNGTTTRNDYLGTNCPEFCPKCRKPRRIEGTNCYVICPIGEGIDSGELENRLNNAVLNLTTVKKM